MAAKSPDTGADAFRDISASLTRLTADKNTLKGLHRGIEKESLRVRPDGNLSLLPHPAPLGSPLTHPSITTDFSEAQLELITGVHPSADACLEELEDIHRFVFASIGDELLWPSSMPCLLGTDEDIPIGRYGSSNIGQAKTVYRRGLGLRYGRLMQTISGIHYNFSVPDAVWQALGVHSQDDITRAYFGLIRNFRRWSWLLLYLFGASPAVCRSFTKHLEHRLDAHDEGSQYLPHATSLRMGPLGYQSSAQSDLHISYNSVEEYAASMVEALTTNYPAYEAHGTRKEGTYHQLNTSILQIENEFYGTIRPKRTIRSGERPVTALRARGVEYVEVRCLDLNPFLPLGIDAAQARFIDTFLLLCLVSDSPTDSEAESRRMGANQLAVVERGRDPALELIDDQGQTVALKAWGETLLAGCARLAEALDDAQGGGEHRAAVTAAAAALEDPARTPSARVLAAMQDETVPFFRFSMQQAREIKSQLTARPLAPELASRFNELARTSRQRQSEIEAADT